MLLFIAISTYLASFWLERFGVGLIFHTITTILLVLRLYAIRCKRSKFITIEILGIVIPMTFALILKKFELIKTIELIVVRVIFMLYVFWDYKEYRFYTKVYTVGEEQMLDDEQ